MFWHFALKRIFFGIVSYACVILMYSVVLNTTLEVTARAQITEMVMGYLMSDEVVSVPYTEEERLTLKHDMTLQLEHSFGLHRPLVLRVLDRWQQAMRLEFGKSRFQTVDRKHDVGSVVLEAAQGTLVLFLSSSIICAFLGLWVGQFKAKKHGSALDKSTSLLTMMFFGTPSWWIGSLMILVFVYNLRWFPAGSFHSTPIPDGFFAYVFDSIYHMVLPVATMVLVGFWGTAYLVRNILMVNLQEDYVMSARSRGIPEKRVVRSHAMRTAAPSVVTMALLSIVSALNGNIAVELVFSWPGLGTLLWRALRHNDIPTMMGILCMLTMIFVASLVFLDLLYGFLDPRINQYGKKA
ncbi:MAG TPA: ABC transporter permease [Thermotogota bacterium]|nr:ABC transporter permease [Thermotogota bacterium]HRW92697.1 ABC transporter permease [Thermotogota bacterium]